MLENYYFVATNGINLSVAISAFAGHKKFLKNTPYVAVRYYVN